MGKIVVTELALKGVKIIEPTVYGDNRGHSFESCSVKDLREAGIDFDCVLEYQAYNKDVNTLRGIHFQNNPHAQNKIVRVVNGAIRDFVIDLRKDSPDYKKWISCELSADNFKQIYIPAGFGHAFITLQADTRVLYKFDDYYNGPLAKTIRWDDPELNIDWGHSDFIMSSGDANAVTLSESDVNYSMEINK